MDTQRSPTVLRLPADAPPLAPVIAYLWLIFTTFAVDYTFHHGFWIGLPGFGWHVAAVVPATCTAARPGGRPCLFQHWTELVPPLSRALFLARR